VETTTLALMLKDKVPINAPLDFCKAQRLVEVEKLSKVLCAAKDETSVEFMRPLLNSWAECSVVISCGKVDYNKSG
jgi:hypothetical protein